MVIAATRSGCCHADPTNNKQAEQQTEPCRRYLNAVVVVRRLLLLLLLTGAGLRGLTSVIGWRMEAHYKISALCLSIRVTERGSAAAAAAAAGGAFNTPRDTTGSRGSAGEHGGKKQSRRGCY